MSTSNGSSGVNPNPSGNADPKENLNLSNSGASGDGGDKTVSYESHQKLLGEKKKRDAENAELKAKLDARDAADAAAAEEAAKKKGDTEALLKLERDKTARAELKAKEKEDALMEVNSRLERGAKMRAFLGSVNGNVDEAYWSLVNLDGIKMGENGLPDPVSVAATARDFEKNYPLVLKGKDNPKTLPGDAPKGGGAKLTYEEWLKLPTKEAKARLSEVVN
jgi:hypothetical protein